MAECTKTTYSAPDTRTATVSGTCTDNAGKTVTASSATFQYEALGPKVSVSLDRTPDHNGWYTSPVTGTTTGTSVSGGVSCTPPSTYNGPDTGAATLSGSCSDNAGESNPGTASFQYEALGPKVTVSLDRTPDHNGWYTSPVTGTTTGTSVSGGISCTAPSTYKGPDTGAATLTGSCSDSAGESNPATNGFQYEASGPHVTVSLDRTPDHNGWYTHPVTGTTTGSSVSGGISCTPPTTYKGADTATATLSGSCSDNAGESNPGTASFQYETSGPTVTVVPSRPADFNGWYTSPVSAKVTGQSVSGGNSCTGSTYNGADTATATLTGSCSDNAGESNPGTSAPFQYEASGPHVTVSLDRTPDHNGWYTSPVTGTTTGTSVSGGISCTAPKTYSGPDTVTATLSGSCSDNAGESNPATNSFQYEALGPKVTVSLDRTPDHNGWYTSPVTGTTTGTSVSGGISCTAPSTYKGPDTGGASITGTCSDNAGESNPGTASFQYETSGPTVTVVPSRPADFNGWYTSPVSAKVTGTSVSGGSVCTGSTYNGSDTKTATLTGSCTDNAGESNPGTSAPFQYEASGPHVTVSLDRTPDHNGWYTSPVTGTTTGSSVSGGVSCTPPSTYKGPDTGAATLTGSCSDNAGESNPATNGFQYEALGPQVSVGLDRAPDHNGWYTHPVTGTPSGTSVSGGVSCTPPTTYKGADTATATLSGSCSDNAGESNPGTATFQYETSGPTVTVVPARPPDHNNWYTSPVPAKVTGQSVSGGNSCTGSTYNGADTAAATLTGSCSDNAGESNPGTSAPFQYEAAGPHVTVALDRTPDHNGWYTSPVTGTTTGSSVSGGISCSPPSKYSGPDTATASITGACTDNAGESNPGSTAFQYDAGGPIVSISLSRAPDHGEWYTHAVSTVVTGASALGDVSCSGSSYNGADTTTATLSGSCTDNAGQRNAATTTPFKYEGSAPTISVTPNRPPDSGNWYNRPVGAAVSGNSFSGIASCTGTTFSGPDTTSATLSGTCTDNAGKSVSAVSAPFGFDNSAPLQGLTADTADQSVTLRWVLTNLDAPVQVELTRQAEFTGSHVASARPVVVYRGTGNSYTDRHLRNGVPYLYTLVATDQAGNVSRQSLMVKPGPRLLAPIPGALVSHPPGLSWTPVGAASYYNVQLFRHGKKIFSAWPTQANLQLKRLWRFESHRFRLSRGRYQWYVWPGYGKRKAARYGELIGSASFTMT